MGEEQVYVLDAKGLRVQRILPFPDGKHLLALAVAPASFLEVFHAYDVDLLNANANDLGDVTGEAADAAWLEAGKSILFSRTVNGLTNIWKFNLKDRSLAQVTFGTGPDFSPMPDPMGKGIYIVNGKSAGILTAYNTHSKESMDIASENATQPAISHDGKRVMYVTVPAKDRNELWVSNIDGSNKVRLVPSGILGTATWAKDNFHLMFISEEAGKPTKSYIIGADGSGLHSLTWTGGPIQNLNWSPDQKAVYINGNANGGGARAIWKESAEGSTPELVVEDCGSAFDMAPDGQYLLTLKAFGDKTGIYEYSLAERKCTLLLPGVVTFGLNFALDGKSFLYAVPSRRDVTIYRQGWQAGKLIGQPQVALKLPFAFPLISGGNAYDFTRDLSTVVYARPGGHADLYLLSQK
jgi:hypothetical protein